MYPSVKIWLTETIQFERFFCLSLFCNISCNWSNIKIAWPLYWKKKNQKRKKIYLTKTPFQLNCKLYNNTIPLHMEFDSCNHSGEGIFSYEETTLKTLQFCVLLWRRHFFMALLSYHILHQNFSCQDCLKKLISDPAIKDNNKLSSQ